MFRQNFSIVHNKAIGEPGKIKFGTQLGKFQNSKCLSLIGYALGGNANPWPNHLMLRFKAGGNQTYTYVQQGGVAKLDERAERHMVFPPGGAETQSGYGFDILNAHGGTIDLQGMDITLEYYDSTAMQYLPFTDYTECALQFTVVSYGDTKGVANY